MPKTFREMVSAAKEQITETTAEEVEGQIHAKSPPLVIDVREEEDYRAGHLEGAVSIPRGSLEMNIDDFTTDEDRPIVLYCGGGSRSALSALTLQQMGFRNIKSLAGGYRNWKESGRAVERGSGNEAEE